MLELAHYKPGRESVQMIEEVGRDLRTRAPPGLLVQLGD